MFDPTKITTFIGLAAAAIWAICYVSRRPRPVVLSTLVVTLVALGTAGALEWTQHVDVCAKAPLLRLNEVCAEGKDCEGGKDFIEVSNPNNETVRLSCYAIGDQRSARGGQARIGARPVVLQGELGPTRVQAWNEDELGFRISRDKGDRVVFFKLKLDPGKSVEFVPLHGEEVIIDNAASYWFRQPEGTGEWQRMSHDAIKSDPAFKSGKKVGSFGRANDK